MNFSTTNLLFSQLLTVVEDDYSKFKKLSERSLSMLGFLFQSTALQALDLIDQQCITVIKTPSGRELFQVQRGASDFHICFKNSNYCSCPAFYFQVLKKEQYMVNSLANNGHIVVYPIKKVKGIFSYWFSKCKHKLATVLSLAMGLSKIAHYSDETVSLMLAGES